MRYLILSGCGLTILGILIWTVREKWRMRSEFPPRESLRSFIDRITEHPKPRLNFRKKVPKI